MVRNALYKKNAGVKLPQIWDKNTHRAKVYSLNLRCILVAPPPPLVRPLQREVAARSKPCFGSLCDELIHQQGQ